MLSVLWYCLCNHQEITVQNQYQFARTDGSYSVYGADFLINKHFENISAWLSYSYADNRYDFDELEEVEFPNNLDIKHAVSIGTSYTLNDLKLYDH